MDDMEPEQSRTKVISGRFLLMRPFMRAAGTSVITGKNPPRLRPIQSCRDPRGDTLPALALNDEADGCATGAADLLVRHLFLGIAILTPGGMRRRFPGHLLTEQSGGMRISPYLTDH